MPQPAPAPICAAGDLPELGRLRFRVHTRDGLEDALLVRFQGRPYAYLNRCVHMGKPLDCEDDTVFDEDGEHLRCSMHGVLYRPETGESLSALCAGKSLTALRVEERDGTVYLVERRVSLAPD